MSSTTTETMGIKSWTAKLLRFLEVPQEEDSKTSQWLNDDLRPVPAHLQTWGWLQYFELWFLVNVNISSYQTGAALLAIGLNWWQAIITIIIGVFVTAFFVVFNSVSGAASHLGYAVVNRSVWGMYGAYFPVLNRILLSFVWYGVQSVIGGNMVYVCLRAIWPSLDTRIPNTLPENIGITTAGFLGFILFNIICCVLIWFRPQKLRIYFHIGSGLSTIVFVCLLGWAVGRWPSRSNLDNAFASQTTLKGSALGWAMCGGVTSILGASAAGIVNQNDFTRFAKRPSQVITSQAISYILTCGFVAICGILVTAATQEHYGNGAPLWDPYTLLVAIQDKAMSTSSESGARAATFFLALAFICSQLSINVPGNVLAGGLDVASLCPKYINLRRGAYILAALSLAPNPWQQLANGSTFITVLSAYAVFIGPFIGLLCVHYYIIQSRRFHYADLYEGSSRSIYWYTKGVNWRTPIAWVVGVAPSLPGFIASVDTTVSVPKGLKNLYNISFIFGFVVAGFVAYALNWLFPVKYPAMTMLEMEGDSDVINGVNVGPRDERGEEAALGDPPKAALD